jgi:hypothetical protein
MGLSGQEWDGASSHSLISKGILAVHVAIQYRLDDLTDGIKTALMSIVVNADYLPGK